jgi:hypothetical protein
MLRRLLRTLTVPDQLFAEVEAEGYREPFLFLLIVSSVIAAFTALFNGLGWPSTDTSASLQAQIFASRVTEQWLVPRLGAWAYVVEAPLIVALAAILAGLMAGFIHVLYRLAGGKGGPLHAWKSVCYGLAPCLLFGWIPYWSLFVGSWALVLQLYFAPKTLYRVREGRALVILSVIVASVLAEFALRGTTVGFGPR